MFGEGKIKCRLNIDFVLIIIYIWYYDVGKIIVFVILYFLLNL